MGVHNQGGKKYISEVGRAPGREYRCIKSIRFAERGTSFGTLKPEAELRGTTSKCVTVQ